jgi:hypothetical protein
MRMRSRKLATEEPKRECTGMVSVASSRDMAGVNMWPLPVFRE